MSLFEKFKKLFWRQLSFKQLSPKINRYSLLIGTILAFAGTALLLFFFIKVQPDIQLSIHTNVKNAEIIYDIGQGMNNKIKLDSSKNTVAIPWNKIHSIQISFNLPRKKDVFLYNCQVHLTNSGQCLGFTHFHADANKLRSLIPVKDISRITVQNKRIKIIANGKNPRFALRKKQSLLTPVLYSLGLPDIPTTAILVLMAWIVFSFIIAFYVVWRRDIKLLYISYPTNMHWSEKIAFLLAYELLLFIFLLCILPVTGFIFNIPILAAYPVIAFVLTLVMCFFINGKHHIKSSVFLSFISFVLITASVYLSIPFEEIVFDAARNHQPSTLLITDGYNPVWNPFISHIVDDNLRIPIFAHHRWVTKGSYVIAATMIKLTKTYSAGNFYHSLLLIISFLITYVALPRKRFSTGAKLLTAFVVACNPVVFGELFSLGPDGVVASLLAIFTFSLLGYSYSKNKNFIPFIIFSAAIAINCKNNIVAYIVCIALALVIFFLLNKNLRKLAPKHIATIIFLILFAAYIGINPFITNINIYNNPLHILVGSKTGLEARKGHRGASVYVSNPRKVAKMNKMGNIELFLYTQIFANSPKSNPAKIKFKTRDMFDNNPHFQPMICGFGSIYKIPFLLSIILLAFVFKYKNKEALLLVLGIFISVAIMPNTYQARYIPQAWLFPILIAVIAYSNSQKNQSKSSVAGFFIASSLLLGAIIQIPSIWDQLRYNNINLKRLFQVPANKYYLFPSNILKCMIYGVKHGVTSRYLNKAVPISYSLEPNKKSQIKENIYTKKISGYMWTSCLAEYEKIPVKNFSGKISNSDYIIIADNSYATKENYPDILKKYSRCNRTKKGLYGRGGYLIIKNDKIIKQMLNTQESYLSFYIKKMSFTNIKKSISVKIYGANGCRNFWTPANVYVNGQQVCISKTGLNIICIKDDKIYCYSILNKDFLIEAVLPLYSEITKVNKEGVK